MASKLWANSLVGGISGALDSIDPNDIIGDGSFIGLQIGDICEITDSTGIEYTYIASESIGAIENVPDVIIPDNNPGNWYWKLVNKKNPIDGMLDSFLYTNTPGGF